MPADCDQDSINDIAKVEYILQTKMLLLNSNIHRTVIDILTVLIPDCGRVMPRLQIQP
jgi:hypothetical protein